MRNKIFTKIIITTLLVTFLTFNVGRVTRVSAVGTTIAAIAGTATLAVGIGFLSYACLTGMAINCPNTMDDIKSWLTGVGEKVMQYPSGAQAYQEYYQKFLNDPLANLLDDVWEWSADKVKAWANDFSDTSIISNILAYNESLDISYEAWNGFDYAWTFQPITDNFYFDGSFYTSQTLIASGAELVYPDGALTIFHTSGEYTLIPTNLQNVRNVLQPNGKYGVQILDNDTWVDFTGSYNIGMYVYKWGDTHAALPEWYNDQFIWHAYQTSSYVRYAGELDYPIFPQEAIYVEAEDRYLPMEIPEDTRTQLPVWVDPDNNNRPIIPWVPIPDIPINIPDPPIYTDPPTWGFPLQELLDLLESLAEALMNLDALRQIINAFAGQHGDTYYIEFNDGDTNYYQYYQPTIYNEGDVVTYNIDVSEEQDKIPVNLNTIQNYTNNRYLDQIKNSAIAGSSMLRDLAVFWHDVDPEVTYIVLGCCILVLIGAFTGKLGHS